jgi:hypothetical protein
LRLRDRHHADIDGKRHEADDRDQPNDKEHENRAAPRAAAARSCAAGSVRNSISAWHLAHG